jgi:tetratricopeptide (TPR) repeat protein
MTARLLPLALLPAVLSAAPPADDALKRGNEAFARKDFAEAVRAYAAAEERIADPGQVAFNKATALYHLGQYREAELHYRRALEDASTAGARRPYGLYNLGNCLLQQAGGRDVVRLRAATGCFEQSLEALPAGDELAGDVRHNLELARLLLAQARAASPDQADSEDDNQTAPRPEEPPPAPGAEDGTGSQQQRPMGPGPTGERRPGGLEQGPAPVPTNDTPPPGAGNLPVLPDSDRPQHLSDEEVSAYLQKAAERIRRDRLTRLRVVAEKGDSGGRDW